LGFSRNPPEFHRMLDRAVDTADREWILNFKPRMDTNKEFEFVDLGSLSAVASRISMLGTRGPDCGD
jgi:hypothetical protein